MSDYHNLRLQTEDFLRQFSHREVLFYPNPGNGGDSLIAAGTYEAFRTCAVNYTPITLDADVSGKIVFLGGGGNYVRLYKNISTAIERFRDRAAKIIVLPHTIRDNAEQISGLDSKFTLFCRDAVGYQYVTSLNTKAEVYLAHDMAFHLNGPDLLKNNAIAQVAALRFYAQLEEKGLSEATI